VVISQSSYDEVMGDRDIAAMKGGGGKSAVERMVEGLVISCRGSRTLKGIKDPVVCWRVSDMIISVCVCCIRSDTARKTSSSDMANT
jgi:hypothetical protein